MISLSTLSDKTPTLLDDGSSTYVTVAATSCDVRVSVAGVTHTLEVGLTSAYETGGRALSAQTVSGSTIVVHDGNQPGEAGNFGPFPILNAIRLMEPTEAWMARARMDFRDFVTPAGFDDSMRWKREDAARAAAARQSVLEHNARNEAERQPVSNPWVAPAVARRETVAELQERLATAGASEW